MSQQNRFSSSFGKFSNWIAKFTGSPAAFIMAVMGIITWGVTGPLFHYADTWQLVINTSTSVITFLMVFVIQQSQNRETAAIQIKLNELIAANKNASNRVVGIENLSEMELESMKDFYDKMAEIVRANKELFTIQSVDKPDPRLSKKDQEMNIVENLTSKQHS